MVAVANTEDGTVNQLFSDFPFKVAGKTGTPETGLEHLGQSSNGVFMHMLRPTIHRLPWQW